MNRALFTGDIKYHPVVDPPDTAPGHWYLSGGAVVDGKAVGPAIPVVIDSGTTLMHGPRRHVQAFYDALPTRTVYIGLGFWAFKSAPVRAGFSFGDGEVYELNYEALCWEAGSRAYIEEEWGLKLPKDEADEGGEWCIGSIATVPEEEEVVVVEEDAEEEAVEERAVAHEDVDEEGVEDEEEEEEEEVEEWLLGAAFMRNYYTAFRHQPAAVGFARLVPDASKMSNQTAAGTSLPESIRTEIDSGARARVPSLALLVLALALAW